MVLPLRRTAVPGVGSSLSRFLALCLLWELGAHADSTPGTGLNNLSFSCWFQTPIVCPLLARGVPTMAPASPFWAGGGERLGVRDQKNRAT